MYFLIERIKSTIGEISVLLFLLIFGIAFTHFLSVFAFEIKQRAQALTIFVLWSAVMALMLMCECDIYVCVCAEIDPVLESRNGTLHLVVPAGTQVMVVEVDPTGIEGPSFPVAMKYQVDNAINTLAATMTQVSAYHPYEHFDRWKWHVVFYVFFYLFLQCVWKAAMFLFVIKFITYEQTKQNKGRISLDFRDGVFYSLSLACSFKYTARIYFADLEINKWKVKGAIFCVLCFC